MVCVSMPVSQLNKVAHSFRPGTPWRPASLGVCAQPLDPSPRKRGVSFGVLQSSSGWLPFCPWEGVPLKSTIPQQRVPFLPWPLWVWDLSCKERHAGSEIQTNCAHLIPSWAQGTLCGGAPTFSQLGGGVVSESAGS